MLFCITAGLATVVIITAVAAVAITVPSVIINCITAVITSVAVVFGFAFVYNILAILIIIAVIAFFG